MVVHYLIAGSLRDAKLTAEVDLKWQQVRPHVYLNEAGEEVQITSAEYFLDWHMRGQRNFILYLGYGWSKFPRNIREVLNEMAPIEEIKIVELV